MVDCGSGRWAGEALHSPAPDAGVPFRVRGLPVSCRGDHDGGALVSAFAARFAQHSPGDRWFVDETYVKVGGVWRYVHRAVDQHGQVIDVLVSKRRDGEAARRFFHRALTTLKVTPSEVVTDTAPIYPRVLDELTPSAWHHVEPYENNRIEADHSRRKHRLRPIRGLRTDHTAAAISTGPAFIQNLRRGHYELAEIVRPLRVAAAFTELATRPDGRSDTAPACPPIKQRISAPRATDHDQQRSCAPNLLPP